MISEILNDVRADLYRYAGQVDPISCAKALFANPGFRWSSVFRASAKLRKAGPLARPAYALTALALRRYRYKFGFDIPTTTEIGPGLFLGHFGGIVINANASIGRNCNISHGVTIGRANRGRKSGAPTIGDRVWIGPNAVIVGAIRIGDDALIAPGAYVTFDVPAGAVVVGNPASVVSMNGNAGYVNRTWPPEERPALRAVPEADEEVPVKTASKG